MTEITEFFFAETPDSFAPSDKLKKFIDSGDKPVLVTFGSMFHRPEETDALFRKIVAAITSSKSRGLVLMPDVDSEKMDLPDDVLVIDDIPYSWLLERVNLVVHHFGFGTTAEVLRAGLPAIPVPHIFDQKIRANQVHKLGFASKPLNRDAITIQKLAEAITSTRNDSGLIARCKEAGEKISQENGLARALSLIHQTFGLRECPQTKSGLD